MIERGLQKLRFFNRIKKTKRIPPWNVDARGIFAHKMLNLEKYSLIFSQRESGIRHKKLWRDCAFLSDMI